MNNDCKQNVAREIAIRNLYEIISFTRNITNIIKGMFYYEKHNRYQKILIMIYTP